MHCFWVESSLKLAERLEYSKLRGKYKQLSKREIPKHRNSKGRKLNNQKLHK